MCPIMVPDIEEPSAEIRRLAYRVLDSLEETRELLPELFGEPIKN
jgi:hypothetical protein